MFIQATTDEIDLDASRKVRPLSAVYVPHFVAAAIFSSLLSSFAIHREKTVTNLQASSTPRDRAD